MKTLYALALHLLNKNKKNVLNQQDGSVSEGCQAGLLEFDLQNPRGGRRRPISTGYSLASTHVPGHVHTFIHTCAQ